MTSRADEIAYEPLGWNNNVADSKILRIRKFFSPKDKSNRALLGYVCALTALSLSIGFIAGILAVSQVTSRSSTYVLDSVAPRIPLPSISREFVGTSAFSREPPQGDMSGNISEPIWDVLIPSKSPQSSSSCLNEKLQTNTVFKTGSATSKIQIWHRKLPFPLSFISCIACTYCAVPTTQVPRTFKTSTLARIGLHTWHIVLITSNKV